MYFTERQTPIEVRCLFTANSYQHSKLYLQILYYFVNLFTPSGQFFEAHGYQSQVRFQPCAGPPRSAPSLSSRPFSYIWFVPANLLFYTFINISGGILTKKMITNFTGYFTCNKTPLVKWVGGSGMWREVLKGNGRGGIFPYISFWSVYSFKCIPLRSRFFKIYLLMRAYFGNIDQY